MSQQPAPTLDPASETPLRTIGIRLADTLRALIDTGASGPLKPTALARLWDLDQTLCTRLIQAIRESDPLVSLQKFPGPAAIRTVVAKSREEGALPEQVQDAEEAIDRFEMLIGQLGGSKANLDTLVARHTDHSRERVERSSKQVLYRGMSGLFGVQAEASALATFVYPNASGDYCDELSVYGYHRLLRLRPERALLMGVRETLHQVDDPMGVVLRSLDGAGIPTTGCLTALKEFSSDPFPEVEIREEDGKLLYVLKETPDEIPRELDLFFASIEQRAEPLYRNKSATRARYAYVPQNPSRHVIQDVYIHKDVWVGVEPEFIMAKNGNPMAPDLLAHSLDRVDFIEQVQRLGTSPSSFATQHYRDHARLIEWVHEQMGWTPGTFRGYRCEVRYPVVGLWYSMQFPLPTP